MARLPWYKCHKTVCAFKIEEIIRSTLKGAKGVEIWVSQEYFERHLPQVGGYYVLYGDSYESYSPAEAFEAGYTLIEGEQA